MSQYDTTRYDQNVVKSLRSEVAQGRKIIGALIGQLDNAGLKPFVSELDLEADPPKLVFAYSPQDAGYYLGASRT